MSPPNTDPDASSTVCTNAQPEDITYPLIITLPCPGQTLDKSERSLKTFQLDVTKRKPKIDQLKELLGGYGLPKSGKRGALIQRLREFSENPAEWNHLFIPSRGRERGDISRRRATTSHAAQRIIAQFGAKEPQLEFLPKKGGAGVRVPQAIPEGVIARNNAWATKVLARSGGPQISQGDQAECDESAAVQRSMATSTHESIPSQSPNPTSAGVSNPANSSPDKGTTGIRRLERRVVDLNSGILDGFEFVKAKLDSMQLAMNAFTWEQGSNTTLERPTQIRNPNEPRAGHSREHAHSESLHGSSESPILFTPGVNVQATYATSEVGGESGYTSARNVSLSALSTASCPPPSPTSEIPPQNLMYFDLDGERVAFDKTSVPNPPSVSFADDISTLFKEWHQSDLLVVGGRGIPIKHWPWFYQRRTQIKNHAWDVVRSRWNKWKFIVEERERFSSEDMFWSQYSDATGKHLNQQAILARLQKTREEDNKRDAAAALQFFNNDLTHPLARGYFKYKKRNVTSVCSKPEAIARKWRELLAKHPDVADAWHRSGMAASSSPTVTPSVPMSSTPDGLVAPPCQPGTSASTPPYSPFYPCNMSNISRMSSAPMTFSTPVDPLDMHGTPAFKATGAPLSALSTSIPGPSNGAPDAFGMSGLRSNALDTSSYNAELEADMLSTAPHDALDALGSFSTSGASSFFL